MSDDRRLARAATQSAVRADIQKLLTGLTEDQRRVVELRLSGLRGSEIAIEMIESIIVQRANDNASPDWPRVPEHAMEDEQAADIEAGDPGQVETHQGLSVEEAQGIVPFDLIDPRDAHEEYQLTGIDVFFDPPEHDRVTVFFQMVHLEIDAREFQISLTNTHMPAPNTTEEVQAFDADGEPVEPVDSPDPIQERIEVDGFPVTRTTLYNVAGDQITIYTWSQDGAGLMIYAPTEIDEDNRSDLDPQQVVPADELHDIVTGIVETRASDDALPEPESWDPPDYY